MSQELNRFQWISWLIEHHSKEMAIMAMYNNEFAFQHMVELSEKVAELCRERKRIREEEIEGFIYGENK